MKLSILVATPPGYNPGMSAVEAGLRLFLRRHGLESAATVYRIHSIEQRMSADERQDGALRDAAASSGLECRTFEHAEDRERFLAGDRILYWGDFLHMAQYVRALEVLDARMRKEGSAAARCSVQDQLLLCDAPASTLARTCSFGTTLLFNSLDDELSSGYGDALRRFVAGARRVWVRDVVSAGKLARLTGDYRTGYWGGDCAQLLDRDGLAAMYPQCTAAALPGTVGWFAGRSGGSVQVIGDTAARCGAALGARQQWLPWGSRSAFPSLVAPDAHAATPFPALLRQLLGCRMVVTDTYHLGVVAWALGIPAVMFFDPVSPAAQNVNSGRMHYWRDKREVFFSQYDALDFLVRPEEVASDRTLSARVAHILEKVGDSALIEAISAAVRGHARATSSDLAAALVDEGAP
jgi:hypothetical protein